MSLLQITRPIYVSIGTDGLLAKDGATESTLSGTANCIVKWNSLGFLEYSGQNVTPSIWLNPGVNSGNYWGRMTNIAGWPLTSGSMNIWVLMNTSPQWVLSNPLNNSTREAQVKMELATDSGGANIIQDVTFFMTATRETLP